MDSRNPRGSVCLLVLLEVLGRPPRLLGTLVLLGTLGYLGLLGTLGLLWILGNLGLLGLEGTMGLLVTLPIQGLLGFLVLWGTQGLLMTLERVGLLGPGDHPRSSRRQGCLLGLLVSGEQNGVGVGGGSQRFAVRR